MMDEIVFKLNRFGIKVGFYLKLWYSKFIWLFLTKWISIAAFWIVRHIKKWNQTYYDKNIVYLYQKVMVRKAFSYKIRRIGMGKGNRNLVVILIEDEQGVKTIELTKEHNPNLFGKK